MGRNVLLIEDEPNIIEAIRFLLSRDGWHVHTHITGKGAYQVVQDVNPDLVILDVMLPVKTGYDILRELRSDPRFVSLPILILTARGQSKDRSQAEELGATAFMTKPFSNAELLDQVRGLLQ